MNQYTTRPSLVHQGGTLLYCGDEIIGQFYHDHEDEAALTCEALNAVLDAPCAFAVVEDFPP